MMWSIMLGLLAEVTTALDAATTLRMSYNPYVLYNFMDADGLSGAANGTSSVADVAGHATINFGNLVLGSRASWLSGRPGVTIRKETGGTASAGLTSANFYNPSWASTFNNTPFVIELWLQTSDDYEVHQGNVFALSRLSSRFGALGSANICNSTEPLIYVTANADLHFRVAVDTASPTPASCQYILGSSTQTAQTHPIAVYLRWSPAAVGGPEMTYYKYEGAAQTDSQTLKTTRYLKWQDASAKLMFSYGAGPSPFDMDFNVLQFAIYPNIDSTQINTLFNKGLPNAKPVAPNIKRSVPETLGGTIQFCPNVIATPRDSDCLDYTNNATASGHTHTLTPSANLAVFILTLPSKGTLSDNGTQITAVPYRLSAANRVTFTPPADVTSWWASWTSQFNYSFTKDDFTTFTYFVQDPDGALSNNATVTIEVYPTHKAPFSGPLLESDSTIYAGRQLNPLNDDNAIRLLPTNTEFIPPASDKLMCTPDLIGVLGICTNHQGEPNPLETVVTIESLPPNGTLKIKVGGVFSSVAVGQEIAVDIVSCATPPFCQPSWIVYYEVPLTGFNSTNASLAKVSFTYSTTTTWDLQSYLGQTDYIVDSAGTRQSVNWSRRMKSPAATVAVDIKNGFYARSAVSVVKQKNLTTIEPQPITLFAEDVTVSNPQLTLWIKSLPQRGGLFLPSGAPITTTTPPPSLPNFTVFYQPNLPTEPYGFESGPNYASFEFYATSAGKTSNIARQVINVVDTNDAVTISWTPKTPNGIIAYKRIGSPQSWSELADNNLYINFTDPDARQPNEPYYEVSLESPDFFIFLEDSVWRDLQVGTGSGTKGQLIGAGTAGAGNGRWLFRASRELAQRALYPIRVRPNKNVDGSILTVKIRDCMLVPGETDPSFSGADWKTIEVPASIVLTGILADKKDDAPIEADPVIVGVIIGVAVFIGVSLLVCIFLIVRCLCRRKNSGGSSSGSAKTGGSTSSKAASKGKGKKAKSAYLHQVEL